MVYNDDFIGHVLYNAGPVRALLPLTAGDRIPGFGLAPGVGIIVRTTNGTLGFGATALQNQSASHGSRTLLTTTECLETTESPLSQGTRHSVL